MVYYNEFDEDIARWLKELIAEGVLPKGDVDTRSIVEVKPSDLKGYTQCHFFAGIGGWTWALKLAGIPEDFNIWTGSCPCQPFSVANSRFSKGLDDERNLWGYFFNLIKECSPAMVVGEQVEAAIPKGWLDIVKGNLESEDYAFGCSVLSASLTGAPHLRRRLYWGGIKEELLEDSDSLGISWRNSVGSEGWSLDNYKSLIKNGYLASHHFGLTENGLKAQEGKRFCLNTELSRWLMGFPRSWSNAVDTVTP